MTPTSQPPSEKERSLDQLLSEKDFIQNGWSWSSFPFWLWFILAIFALALLWGSWGGYERFVQKEKSHEPFLEVTNRQFSVFLWQFPAYLRSNVRNKNGYLPGFLPDRESLNLSTTEAFVSAPPDLIFLYQTWQRLLSSDFIPRPIGPDEFTEFLGSIQEWQPAYWSQAPEEYAQLINTQSYLTVNNLQTLSEATLPLIVRQAFQGWKNYFKEGVQINEMSPTIAEIQAFLQKHPGYARHNWRNIDQIVGQQVAGLNYLAFLLQEIVNPEEKVPSNQLSPFLKVALFNAQQAQQDL